MQNNKPRDYWINKGTYTSYLADLDRRIRYPTYTGPLSSEVRQVSVEEYLRTTKQPLGPTHRPRRLSRY